MIAKVIKYSVSITAPLSITYEQKLELLPSLEKKSFDFMKIIRSDNLYSSVGNLIGFENV